LETRRKEYLAGLTISVFDANDLKLRGMILKTCLGGPCKKNSCIEKIKITGGWGRDFGLEKNRK
jgi:hypothetical protein